MAFWATKSDDEYTRVNMENYKSCRIWLDDAYYDKDSESSRQKIIVEYMKAVDALTIN